MLSRVFDKVIISEKNNKFCPCLFSLKVLKDMVRHFKVGSGHQCTVLNVNQEQKFLDLSMSGAFKSKVIDIRCSNILRPNI